MSSILGLSRSPYTNMFMYIRYLFIFLLCTEHVSVLIHVHFAWTWTRTRTGTRTWTWIWTWNVRAWTRTWHEYGHRHVNKVSHYCFTISLQYTQASLGSLKTLALLKIALWIFIYSTFTIGTLHFKVTKPISDGDDWKVKRHIYVYLDNSTTPRKETENLTQKQTGILRIWRLPSKDDLSSVLFPILWTLPSVS
jgi:hypothetical protein